MTTQSRTDLQEKRNFDHPGVDDDQVVGDDPAVDHRVVGDYPAVVDRAVGDDQALVVEVEG